MHTEHHLNVVNGWIDANIRTGTKTLDSYLAESPLHMHDDKQWMCAVTNLEALFKCYLELIDDIDNYELPVELKSKLLTLSDYWELVIADRAIN